MEAQVGIPQKKAAQLDVRFVFGVSVAEMDVRNTSRKLTLAGLAEQSDQQELPPLKTIFKLLGALI
jgi:hypothetical protein